MIKFLGLSVVLQYLLGDLDNASYIAQINAHYFLQCQHIFIRGKMRSEVIVVLDTHYILQFL